MKTDEEYEIRTTEKAIGFLVIFLPTMALTLLGLYLMSKLTHAAHYVAPPYYRCVVSGFGIDDLHVGLGHVFRFGPDDKYSVTLIEIDSDGH